MIYDIFVYSYSRVHVNGFWEIIITFLFYFLILIYFFYFWDYVSYPYYACEIRCKNDQNLLGWKKNPERMSWILLVFRWWQMFSNLVVTGVIGPADEEVMNKRRCACEDVMQKDEVMNPVFQPQQFNLGKFWY